MPEFDSNMHVILFEDQLRSQFLPLVFTRPVGELRLGIGTIGEQWRGFLRPTKLSHAAHVTIQKVFPTEYGDFFR